MRQLNRQIGPERVVLAFEDRPPVCEAYRHDGVRVVAVNHGEENREVNEAYRRMA